MRIKVLGKYWRLTFPKFMGELDGDCTSPTATHKGIRIAAGLRGFDFLETCIHEVMHAGNWHASEDHVREFSEDLARILTHPEIQRRINGEK